MVVYWRLGIKKPLIKGLFKRPFGQCLGSSLFRRIVALFLNLGGRLALATAEVVKTSLHYLRNTLNRDFLDIGGVYRESAFDAFAKGNTANGESFLDVTTFTGDDDTGEDLGALFVAFANLSGNADAVADFENVITATLQLRLGGVLEEGMVAHGWFY